jgi:PAS domain S-box-containing protein
MQPQNILIIEDNAISRKVLRLCLEAAHYTVVEAADGASAIHAASTQKFDLIIQDLFLPDMNGFILNQKLRLIPSVLNIPIFALSGYLNPNDTHENQTGFTKYITKPVDPSYLLLEVKAHLPPPTPTLLPKSEQVNNRTLTTDDFVLTAAYDQLVSAENKFQKLITTSNLAIFIIQARKFVYVNPSALNLLGITSINEIISSSFDDFISLESKEKINEAIQKNISLALLPGQMKNLAGKIFDVEIDLKPLLYIGQKLYYIIIYS